MVQRAVGTGSDLKPKGVLHRMTRPTFTVAHPITHRDALLRINLEYMSWVTAEIEKAFGVTTSDILGMPLPDYVAGAIDKVCGDAPPRGVFYLVERGGALAGMGGLRRVRDGVAEIKRLYVRPAHRGERLGETVLQRLLGDASGFGYSSVVLDSAPFMRSAQRLYEAAGFADRVPYPETEVPPALHGTWRFMERAV